MTREVLRLFCVAGQAEIGYSSKTFQEIEEFVHAYSTPQAVKLIGMRLEKRFGQRVYIGDCDVYELKTRADKKRSTYQKRPFKRPKKLSQQLDHLLNQGD